MYDVGLFAPAIVLLGGAVTGLLFGFILQKAGMTDPDVILGQFLLTDFSIMKVMGTAIVVGGIGVLGMHELGLLQSLHVKSATLLGNALGGVIFGTGMAVLAYCPGTAMAAIGDGHRDAVFGLLGGIGGAALYAEAHPWFVRNVNEVLDVGKVTLPDVTGVPGWVFIGAIAGLVMVVIRPLPDSSDAGETVES